MSLFHQIFRDLFSSQNEIRKANGVPKLSQKECAKLLGINEKTFSSYMTGRTLPNAEQLSSIAEFFEVTPNFLLGWHSSEIENPIHVISEYTGLSYEAIQALHEHKSSGTTTSLNIINAIIALEQWSDM